MSSDSNSVSSRAPLLEHKQNSFPQSGLKLKEAWLKGQTLEALSLAQQESTPSKQSPAPEDSEKHRPGPDEPDPCELGLLHGTVFEQLLPAGSFWTVVFRILCASAVFAVLRNARYLW